MDIPGISANDYVFGGQDTATQDLDQGAFMKLLVTQMRHQDPLEPIANEDFVAQLATFSSLEELEGLNQNIIAMITLNQSNALVAQLSQGSSLIGREVSWTDPSTGESGSGLVDSVKIVDGLAVLTIGDQEVPLVTVTEVLGEDGGGTGDDSSDNE